jgi:hypothetical protein
MEYKIKIIPWGRRGKLHFITRTANLTAVELHHFIEALAFLDSDISHR